MAATKKVSSVSSSERGWRNEFEQAFTQGRFKDAARTYDLSAGPSERIDVTIRGAQAHMHFNPPGALRLLLSLKIPASKGREQVERDALLAEAFARTNDFESADNRLSAALETARRLKDPELVAMVGYRFVRRHLQAEDAASARRALELARKGQSRKARIYALHAEALILSYEERVRDQADRLVELLRSIDPQTTEFINLRAWGTHNLAALVRELYLPDAVAEIERQLGGVPWPADFDHNRFQALKALAWAKAMQGDYFNAFRHLKLASEVADTMAWKVVAACDRAYLARAFGEHRWSRVELDEAEQLAGSVEWHATLNEERIGLLLLAELFGEIDTARAAMYLARYRELGDVKSPLFYRRDARRNAFAQYSTGVVELGLGNKKRGLAELRDARKVFERFGYDFRVARCLVDEYGATGDQELLPVIEEKLRNYRQSWLMTQLRTRLDRPEVPLPPMQRKVFAEVCAGKSTAEIAQSLDRSEYTVSNHIKQIFKTFEVRSRSALVAEAVRRGMVKTG
jgi:DNA-binding CsgD family transcriptional regulator